MFLREAPTLTLQDVADDWTTRSASWGGGLHKVDVDLTSESRHILLGEHEVAVTPEGLTALGGHLGIPTKYLLRVPADEQEWMLKRRLERAAEEDISVSYTTDGGITEVSKSGARRITPEQITSIAVAVMPTESMVTDAWVSSQDLRLDVIAPEDFGRGWVSGDDTTEYQWRGEKKVGDITGAGLRITQNRKQNLAPGVEKLMYRLACTNGYEVAKVTGRMDARGMGVEEMLVFLEGEARRLFGQVEDDIRAFYDMRNQPVSADRTGDLRRITQESGLPSRTVGLLEDALPEFVDGERDATMFDFINVITNYANSSSIRGNAARTLQRVGGSLISDHAARCKACHHKLH